MFCVEVSLEGIACGGVDGDDVLALGKRGDVNGAIGAADLGGDIDRPVGRRGNLHVIVADGSRPVDDNLLIDDVKVHVRLIGGNKVVDPVSSFLLQGDSYLRVIGKKHACRKQ